MSVGVEYTAEENLKRIIMDANTKYILVEGESDIPMYENIMRIQLANEENSKDFEIVHSGCKADTLDFMNEHSAMNVFAIVDLDFDYEISDDNRILTLGKYTIENYLYSDDVIVPLLGSVLKIQERVIKSSISLGEWRSNMFSGYAGLLKSIYYYQVHAVCDRCNWTRHYMLKSGRDMWEVDGVKVKELITRIRNECGINQSEINGIFPIKPLNRNKFFNCFPGKLLLLSFYKYLKVKSEELRPGFFSKAMGNMSVLVTHASFFLARDKDFYDLIEPAVIFIRSD